MRKKYGWEKLWAKILDDVGGPLEMWGNLLNTATRLGGEQYGIWIPAGTSCLLRGAFTF